MKYEQRVFDELKEKLIRVNIGDTGSAAVKVKKRTERQEKLIRLVQQDTRANSSLREWVGEIITVLEDDGVDYKKEALIDDPYNYPAFFKVGTIVQTTKK